VACAAEGEVVSARETILARVRAAQAGGHLPESGRPSVVPGPGARSAGECLERFREELTALGVESHLEATEADVRRRVEALVEGKRVLAWDGEHLPYGVASVLGAPAGPGSPRDVQAAAEIGVTGCNAAIAETGSVVLLSGPGRSRAVSLLPAVHLALVRRSDLRFSLGEFLRGASDALAGSASCTVVTGPSRTADIELTLTLGVHGPGSVVVVIGP
jgi:L-lactate dehydrogenase complex protein LldG